MLNYKIPDETELKKKYPVLYPSEYTDTNTAEKYTDIILKGFEEWNKGSTNYVEWIKHMLVMP